MKFMYILLSVLIISCGTANLATKQNLVSPGQTKNEVLSFMGAPSDRQFNGTMEAWQYCSTGWSVNKFTIVWFNHGSVTGLSSYSQSCGGGSCTQCFRSIRWEEAPDKIIEHRLR